jgi:hypothetical protein
MKLWHWILAAFVLYEGVVGTAEIIDSVAPNSLADSVAAFPSVGGTVGPSFGVSNTLAGGIDLGLAVLLYFFVLHDHIFRTLMRP